MKWKWTPRVAQQSLVHRWGLVGGEVVEDDVQVEVGGNLRGRPCSKRLMKSAAGVGLAQVGDDLAGGDRRVRRTGPGCRREGNPFPTTTTTTGRTQSYALNMRDGRVFRFGSKLEADAANVRQGYAGTVST